MIVEIRSNNIAHLVECRIYVPDDKFSNSKLFPKNEMIEYWSFLIKYYSPNSEMRDFNSYLSTIDMLDNTDYEPILKYEIINDFDYYPEYFVFDFPDEETALYFKLKYCKG